MTLSAPETATLAALYATFVPPEAPRGGVQAMAAALERLPAHRLAELRRFLAVLRTPAFPLALCGIPKRFENLEAAQRERVMRAMSDHPAPQLRTAYQAMKRLALFIAYTYCDGVDNPLWERIAYPGPRADVPVSSFEFPLATVCDLTSHYDVIVIGSGAGGGVAAGVCAAAGMSVLVLEAGPPVSRTARLQREFDAFADLYLDAALTSTEDLGVSILAGSCIGGGTSVNWSTSLHLHQNVAREWSAAAGGIDFDDGLTGHYRAVSERLGLAPTLMHNANNAVLKRGAEALDWRGYAHPRNAVGCGAECGYCGFGCAYDRKASTARTYLLDAAKRNAHVVANARAERIHCYDGRARAVNVRFQHEGEEVLRTIAADRVIVAAGSLRTPALLAAGGVASPHLGAHLRLHPTTAILAEFDEAIEPWNGPMQSYLIDEFGSVDGAYGVKLEAVPAHPGLAALAVPWNGASEHDERMKKISRTAALIALVRDRGEGRAGTGEDAKIRYRLNAYDARHLRLGMQKLAHAALAAGARRVQTLHNRPIETGSIENLREFERETNRASTAPNRLGVFSAHQMGTARMHANARDGVVDPGGRVHGYGNLYVADASVFPLASGVNPMLTIMAMAHRTATGLTSS